ncbi:MAG TPA: hypothetical protein VFZ31_07310 [Vicinamibacterales bacterium]
MRHQHELIVRDQLLVVGVDDVRDHTLLRGLGLAHAIRKFTRIEARRSVGDVTGC